MNTIHVLAIPGSLRANSLNRAALVSAADLAPDGMVIELADLDDIPFYNGDIEATEGFPASVASLRDRVAAADALLLATPEYNGSTTGVLKNGLDWLSRGGPDSPLRSKPTAILGAGGRFGSLRAQLHLREIMTNSGSDLVSSPQVMIDAASTRFDEHLALTEERYRKQIAGLLVALSEKVAAHR